jgi:hypothetical protein
MHTIDMKGLLFWNQTKENLDSKASSKMKKFIFNCKDKIYNEIMLVVNIYIPKHNSYLFKTETSRDVRRQKHT